MLRCISNKKLENKKADKHFQVLAREYEIEELRGRARDKSGIKKGLPKI